MNAIIHSFESLAAVDGEGLRYAIFFSGCPLRCIYCHNPDTWTMNGMEVTPAQLIEKVKRYKPYFKDNGGITFTGGEPMLQADFIEEIIPMLKKENINYAIDSSGMVELTESVKNVYKNAQMVILDLKFHSNNDYNIYTGGSLDKVLDTLKFLEEINKKTWIRTVIVPGINNSKKDIDKYFSLISDISCIEKYELLPFHTMGFYKYEKSGIKNPLKDLLPPDKEEIDMLQKYLNEKLNN